MIMANKAKPGGAIWKTGTHDVNVNGKGTHLIAPEYSLKQYYNVIKRKIENDGFIPIGIDHISDELLASNPVLADMLKEKGFDVHNVGKIYDVQSDGTEIRIKDSEITDPTVRKLYDEGKLNAWSVVSDIHGIPCPSRPNTTIADYFRDIDRVDFVGAGGCKTCRVDDKPLETAPNGNISLNAQYMEVNKMTEPNLNEPVEPTEPTEPVEPVVNPEPEPVVEPPNEPEPEPVETKVTSEWVKGLLADFKDEMVGVITDTVKGETGKVEAKLAEMKTDTTEMKLEAKKAVVGSKIDAKIKEGFITPSMRDGLLEAGLAVAEDEKFDTMLAGFNKKLWEGGQVSRIEAKNAGNGYSYKDYEKQCKEIGVKP